MKSFVNEGGFLFTTDWALTNVLEKAFPGYVEQGGRNTADEVVRVEILDNEDPYLNSLIGPDDDPQWWLEGSSYPIRVIDRDAVKVLITSKEIERRYGESPVLITFKYGKGTIYHMISHFYLQRSETRTKRHRKSGMDYVSESDVSPALYSKYKEMGAEKEDLGDIESAYWSSAVMNRVVLEKKRRLREGQIKKEKATLE